MVAPETDVPGIVRECLQNARSALASPANEVVVDLSLTPGSCLLADERTTSDLSAASDALAPWEQTETPHRTQPVTSARDPPYDTLRYSAGIV